MLRDWHAKHHALAFGKQSAPTAPVKRDAVQPPRTEHVERRQREEKQVEEPQVCAHVVVVQPVGKQIIKEPVVREKKRGKPVIKALRKPKPIVRQNNRVKRPSLSEQLAKIGTVSCRLDSFSSLWLRVRPYVQETH